MRVLRRIGRGWKVEEREDGKIKVNSGEQRERKVNMELREEEKSGQER